jgi:hypothetical protein
MSQPVDFGYDLPFEQMQQALLMKNAYQEQALAQSELLGEVQNVREVDKPLISKYKENLDSQIEELSRMDLTSREGRQKFNDLSKTVRKAVGPTGAIGAAYNNYAQEQAYIKHIKEHKDMSPNRKNELIQLVTSGQYNPAVIQGEIGDFYGGEYSKYKTIEPSKEVDIAKDLDERLKGFMANSYSTEKDKVSGAWIYRDKITGKEVTPEEIMEASLGIIYSNPDLYYQYIQEGAMLKMPGFTDETVFNPILPFSAIDPKTNQEVKGYMPNPNSPLGQAIGYVMSKYGFKEESRSNTLSVNAYTLQKHKAELDKEEVYSFDVESKPTMIKIPTLKNINDSISLSKSSVQNEVTRIEKELGASLGINASKMDQTQIEEKIRELKKQNIQGGLSGQLDKLIDELSSLHMSNQAFSRTQKEIFDNSYQSFNGGNKELIKQYYESGRFKLNSSGDITINFANSKDQYTQGQAYKDLTAFSKILSQKAKNTEGENNEYSVPATQSSTWKVYDDFGQLASKQESDEATKTARQIGKDGNAGNALIYAVKDGVIQKETNTTLPKGSYPVFDNIPRADGSRYIIYTHTNDEGVVTQYALPMDSIVLGNGKKVKNSAASKVDSMVIRMAQENIDTYEFPLVEFNDENKDPMLGYVRVKIDSKGAGRSYPTNERFHNNNNLIVEAFGKTYYGPEAVRMLVNLDANGDIRLLNIK